MDTIPIRKLLIRFVLLELILLASHAYFSPVFALGEAHLKDISGVAIFTENFSNYVNKDILNLEKLEKTLAEKLIQSRINLYKKSQWQNKIGGSYIKFKIISSKFNKVDSYAVYVDLELYRPVVVLSFKLGENKSVVASTWSTSKLFPCSIEEFQSCVEDASADLLDIFINEYKSANGII